MSVDIAVARQSIITAFGKAYELNDLAHREDHFEEVNQTALFINNELDMQFDEVEILFAAYFHDLFAWSRNNHHELSHHWISTTDHPLIVEYLGERPWERERVALACLEHRASYEEEFSTEFSALINAADRGMPCAPEILLRRAIKYREFHFPNQTEDQRIAESIKHIKEKFGKGGYARYPDVYRRAFVGALEAQQEAIAKL